MSAHHFADRLIQRVRQLGHPLCVGLDPHLPLIPPLFRRGTMAPNDPQSAGAVETFLLAILDRVAESVAVVKPQIAFFEQLGWRGIQTLERVITAARARGLLVVLDAKRGDVASTAVAYATYLDSNGPMPVDAMTVNPYLGRDSLAPFMDLAARDGKGVFVLVKNSNPGSADYQEQLIDGRPLYAVIAASLANEASRLVGAQSGWSSLGVVVGATQARHSACIRAALPRALFLVPGYGEQGGTARDAVSGFVDGPNGREGGFVSASRAVLFPDEAATDNLRTWERAVDAARDRAVAELRAAIRT